MIAVSNNMNDPNTGHTEIWRDIPKYEGKYQISNFGRVKSVIRKNRKSCKILKQASHSGGYKSVGLYANKVLRAFYVHRIVAEVFLGNPKNKPEVDHIDGNPSNNAVSNLRWATTIENRNNPITVKRYRMSNRDKANWKAFDSRAHSVVQLDKSDNVVRIFQSLREARRNGYTAELVAAACKGEREYYKGYKWSYFEKRQ